MKKPISLFLLISFSVIMLLSSCGDSDEISANETTTITNKSLAFYPKLLHTEQREVYSKLNPQEKMNLWNERFDTFLKTVEDENEKNVILSMIDLFSKDMFEKGISNESFAMLMEPKLNALEKDFGWSNDDIFIVFSTLYPVSKNYNKSGTDSKNLNVGLFDAGFEYNCTCRWGGIGCSGGECRDKSLCSSDRQNRTGCGFLWQQSCTGRCYF